MRPNAVLLILVLGSAKIGELVAFCAVAPICMVIRSLTLMRLITFRLRLLAPGPRRIPKLEGPSCPGRGLTRRGLPLASAIACKPETARNVAELMAATDGSRIWLNP